MKMLGFQKYFGPPFFSKNVFDFVKIAGSELKTPPFESIEGRGGHRTEQQKYTDDTTEQEQSDKKVHLLNLLRRRSIGWFDTRLCMGIG